MSAIHHNMMNANDFNYMKVNAFLFESETPFSAEIIINKLNQGVVSTIIDWGDGTESSASTGTTKHDFESGGQFVVKIPNDVDTFGKLRYHSPGKNLQMKQILNVYGIKTAHTFDGGNNSQYSLFGKQTISSAKISTWAIAAFPYVTSIDCYNFENFANVSGALSNDWVFPLLPELESITFHGKSCNEMLNTNNFYCITNCMQPGSTGYLNTVIYCDDGYIQYDIDRYGRENPVLGHYKTVLY